MRKALTALMVPLIIGIMSTAALAVSPHLKGRNPISFTDGGLTLTATVSYAGLGNYDTLQVLTAKGNATSTCTNPSGQNQPPGQNPAPVTTAGSTPVSASEIKNGNVTITTKTDAPRTPIPGAPDCPNSKWTETITDVAFTSATIQLYQNRDTTNDSPTVTYETLVLTVNCTFTTPTSDGLVPTSNYTCAVA